MDIALQWTGLSADVVRNASSLQGDSSLYSEVVVRLFSDRRAPADAALPDAATDRRGCWADSYDEELGSHLWLLSRAKLTPQTAQDAQHYIEVALGSLIDQGKATSIQVITEIRKPSMLAIYISITLPSGKTFEPFPEWLSLEL